MPAGAASRYAIGAGGVGAVRLAPAASLISACATRSALGARRCAPRALRACVPDGAAAVAAIAATRYALGADGVGAARPGACGSPASAKPARRCAHAWGAVHVDTIIEEVHTQVVVHSP